jgi:hypothetical protein
MRPPVVLWSLDRVSFRTIVLEANTKKAASYEDREDPLIVVKILSAHQSSEARVQRLVGCRVSSRVKGHLYRERRLICTRVST